MFDNSEASQPSAGETAAYGDSRRRLIVAFEDCTPIDEPTAPGDAA